MTHAIKRLMKPRADYALGWLAVTVGQTVGYGALACSSDSPVVESAIELEAGSVPRDESRDGGEREQGDSGTIVSPEQDPVIQVPQSEPTCGNGSMDEGEACDDGNADPGDGCSGDCTEVEQGYSCRNAGETCGRVTVCGDARQTGQEQCDDGNAEGGDGCSPTCRQEADFACIALGEPCVSTIVCGDGKATGPETCDDGDAEAGDGCDEECQTEEGFTCTSPGVPCQPTCGDARIVGREQCDDGNLADGDGCSASCRREPGYACDDTGCHQTECGDGVTEGDEACDDGADIHSGDGCSPGCVLEPSCMPPGEPAAGDQVPVIDGGHSVNDAGQSMDALAGACFSTCGDGLILGGDVEECDDGNNVAFDGCDPDCREEPGWACSLVAEQLPDSLTLPIVYRDFIMQASEEATLSKHPDFQSYTGGSSQMIFEPTPDLVQPHLGADGKPVYSGLCEAGADMDPELCPFEEQMTSEADFDQWYRDTENVNIPVLDHLILERQPDDTYVFDVESGLFPLDGAGWVTTEPPQEVSFDGHNFGFTSELRHWFEFKGGEHLEFSGDDDVWVFIGGRLVIDLGGIHSRLTDSVTLDETTAALLGLVPGRVYELALFHAERRTSESNFKLSIGGFVASKTSCETECGDGIIAGDERCDDGADNGKGYGFCDDTCTLGERCGDGELNGDEACDNGINLSGYVSGAFDEECAPGCVLPPHCGDGRLDSDFGEECDEGAGNTGDYEGCNRDCTLARRCGDGKLDDEEECDDGNRSNSDACDVECKERLIPEPR